MSTDTSSSPSSQPPVCPRCATPRGDLPYCGNDGTLLTDAFVLGGRYRVSELIGAGGFAFVFGGQHLVLTKQVAIKILRGRNSADSKETLRFLREARTSSQLSHENIVSIIDFGHDEQLGSPYLVMERVMGLSLADVLKQSGPISASRALTILVQLARAMSHAHMQGIVHRDISPKNVLLGQGDQVKLCDFGLSFLLDDASVSISGRPAGTPAYMSPEQIRGDGVTEKADIYAFACVAYELLAGVRPHPGETPAALFANRLADHTVFALNRPDVPEELEDLIIQCLSAEPTGRPSADEIALKLLSVGAASGTGRKVDLTGESIGSYRVQRLLGKGGAGSVFLGEHPVIGSRVAIKVLSSEVAQIPGMAERFVQEARAANNLKSPHITRYIDFGVLPDGRPYAVMELLEGESLSAIVEKDAPMAVPYVRDIMLQIGNALAKVHALGVVHRDIKPDNLFICKDDRGDLLVKILDFGIAKAFEPGAAPTQTTFGMILGTPAYCAPEQSVGAAVSPASDVYALACTAFEMLTGRTPFVGSTVQILGEKVVHEPPRADSLRPTLPTQIADDLALMLKRIAAERMSTMLEFVECVSKWGDVAGHVAYANATGRHTVVGLRAHSVSTPMPYQASVPQAGITPAPTAYGVPTFAPPTNAMAFPAVAQPLMLPDSAPIAIAPPKRWPWVLGASVVLSSIALAVIISQTESKATGVAKPAEPDALPAAVAPPTPDAPPPELPAVIPTPTSEIGVGATATLEPTEKPKPPKNDKPRPGTKPKPKRDPTPGKGDNAVIVNPFGDE